MNTKETGARRKIFSSRNDYNTRDDGVSSDTSELGNTASRLDGQLEAVRKYVGDTLPTPTPARASARLYSQTPASSQSLSRELLETIVNSHTKLVHAVEKQAKEQLIMAQQIYKLQKRVETMTNVQSSEIPNIKDSLEEITDTFCDIDGAQNEIRAQLGDLARSCVKREDMQANIEQTLEMNYPYLSEAARPHLSLQYAPGHQSSVPPAQSVQDIAQPDHAEISRFQNNCKREVDLYYLRTIEIKGFGSKIFERMQEDVTRSPRHWAAKIMAQDNAACLAYSARKVKFFWPDTGRAASLRLTYDSMSEVRQALTRLGGARNSLRGTGPDTRLEFYQLTPPRFHRNRIQLYNLLKSEKAQGNVKNFSFLVVDERLCSVIRARQDNQFVTRLVAFHNGFYDDLLKIQNSENGSDNNV